MCMCNNAMTTKMTLRELLIERIHYAMDEEELLELYSVHGDELEDLSDVDLFEIYEEVTIVRE